MAYAAAISLKHTILRLKNFNPKKKQSLYEELDSLGCILRMWDDRIRSIDRHVSNAFDAKIRDAVWKLEDVLESSLLPPAQGLHQKGVEQELDSCLKTVMELREEYNRELQRPLSAEDGSSAISPIHDDFGGNTPTMVGLWDQIYELTLELVDSETELKTVSLVGMAGIGKTCLAREIYQHPLILQHFHSRVWVSIGPKDHVCNISEDIISQIERKPRDLYKGKSRGTLRELLRNSLRGRRYLIVLDDIWNTRVLNYFIELLPDYGNRSRFLLTTRQQEVAGFQTSTKIHQMPFLNNEESWNLLRQNVFVEESNLPSQLEKAGRKIAEKCEGLPLLILAVANILRELDKTEEFWNKIAEKKTTTFTDAYDQIYEVLLPSYDYLSQHLKSCFLYIGVCPQSCEIPLSKLINLWAVEDFLEPSGDEKLEDFAKKCLKDLVSKSLAIVCKRSFERVRRIKSFKLHCAYWYLCVTEARKSNFLHVLNKLIDVSKNYIESQRRLSVQNNILFGIQNVYDSMAKTRSSTTRSLLFTGEDHQYPVRICFNMMLLKVLDGLAIRFYEFPEEVLKLLLLRYLALTHNGDLPCSISKLQQLECLILRQHHNIKFLHRDSKCLPEDIWDMQELRHVRIMGSKLPDPSKGAELPNLSTLYVNADSCTEDIFKSIPNLKKLGIKIELEPDSSGKTLRWLEHIKVLDGLESLKCVVMNPRLRSQVVAPAEHLIHLPWCKLKKLSLSGLAYPWKYMSVIGSLIWLQVLKLRCSAFQGAEWEAVAGQFQSLEFLLLEDIDLVQWTAKTRFVNSKDYECFPSLCHLILRHCYKLNKVPLEIGENQNLATLEVDDCSPSVVASAHQIKNKAKSSHLQLLINSSWNL